MNIKLENEESQNVRNNLKTIKSSQRIKIISICLSQQSSQNFFGLHVF